MNSIRKIIRILKNNNGDMHMQKVIITALIMTISAILIAAIYFAINNGFADAIRAIVRRGTSILCTGKNISVII